ncbi:hypothetical protein [Granulicella tundricola]|nr:hypothetical protein [Granulicella tundricola]
MAVLKQTLAPVHRGADCYADWQMPSAEIPQWLDETEISTVGILTLENGEHLTVEIIEYVEEDREVIVEVISPSRRHADSQQERQSIAIDRVLSFKPQARAVQPWPHSDPCRSASFSFARFIVMTMLLLSMTAGSLTLFILLANKPYGIQEASVVEYTLFEIFLTFAATRSLRRYLFTCPAVRPQIPRLLWRHLGYVITLVIFQAVMLAARPNLSSWWNTPDKKGSTPFEIALFFLCFGIGYAQVLGSRSILERAHQDFSTPG